MLAPFSSFLLFFSMLSAVSALVPDMPVNTAAAAIQDRQASRSQIVRKQVARKAQDGMRASLPGKGSVVARTPPKPDYSSRAYPKCPDYQGLGYANYRGWDYFGHDVSTVRGVGDQTASTPSANSHGSRV